jgi:Tfp pilus assembly protein PilF
LNEAVSEFAEALRLDPENADAHVNLAYTLTLQGNIDEAITHYEQALRLKPENLPENAETLNELGVLYGRKGKLAEALDKFERAVRVNPDHAGARENLKRARAAVEKIKARKP